MEKLSFSVAEYEAPLDLILHLVSKHKLDILDIDISSLLEQYLETISSWQEQNLEVAGEFLEMASRLVYMKTVSLLPRHEDEREKLRQELTGRLIEYSICKQAAKTLGTHYIGQDVFVRDAAPIEQDSTYTLTHNADVLFAALSDAMGKGARRIPPPREAFDSLVTRPVVSVTVKIFSVLRTLRTGGSIRMEKLFSDGAGGRSALVATFLAVLELIKSKKVMLREDELILTSRDK